MRHSSCAKDFLGWIFRSLKSLYHRDRDFSSSHFVPGQNDIHESMRHGGMGHGRRKDFFYPSHTNSSLLHSAILFFLAPCARRDTDTQIFTTLLYSLILISISFVL